MLSAKTAPTLLGAVLAMAGCGSATTEPQAPPTEMLGRELAVALTHDVLSPADAGMLLAQGANPNARAPLEQLPTPLGERNTAISAASYHGRAEIVDMLLRAGATPCIPDDRGNNAHWFAAEGARHFATAPRQHDGVTYLLSRFYCP